MRTTRYSRRALLRGAAAVGLALPALEALPVGAMPAVLPAAGGTISAAPRRAGGTAIVAVNASPTSWDLTKADWVTWQGVNALYDTLLVLDDQDQLQPNLVERWNTSEDGLVWDLRLRSGVSFHDGTPFNAEAVKFNFERHMTRQDSRYYDPFKWIDRIETPEPLNARVYLKEMRADFGYELAQWGALQVSPEAFQRLGDRYGTAPVGTGPFKFKAYEPDSHIDYVRNETYWGGAPKLDGLRIRIIPEANIRLTELQGRTVDVVYGLEPKDVQSLQDAGIKVERRVTPGSQMISLNTSQGPTAELAVRRAIARAVDRDTIIAKVLFNQPEKARAGAPTGSPYYHGDLPMVEYNPDEAGKLLDEAGWKMGAGGMRERNGQPLFVNILSTDANNWSLFNQIIQEQLKAIGIDSQIQSYEWGTMLDYWRENKGEWHVSYHSQGSTLYATSPIPAAWDPDNFWNICQIKRATDPQLMQVAEDLRAVYKEWQQTSDLEKRKALARRAQQLYSDNQLVVWMWHTPTLIGVAPRLKNYRLTYNGRVVWLPEAEVE